MDPKTTRSRNYSEKERMHFLSLIEKYKNVVENKKTDGTTIQKKKDAWEKISNEFNASSDSGTRTVQQLKLLLKNLKKNARNSVATEHRNFFFTRRSSSSDTEVDRRRVQILKSQDSADKKDFKKTGGGIFIPQLQESGAQILALMGDRFEPQRNPYDSSAIYHGTDTHENRRIGDFSASEVSKEIVGVGNEPVAGPSWLDFDHPLENSELEAMSVVFSSSTSPIPITTTRPPTPLPRQNKKKLSKVTISSSEEIKKEYFATKLRLARFQLRSAKIQHAIDMKIKRQQLKKVMGK